MDTVITVGLVLLIVWGCWRFVYFHRNPRRLCPTGADLVCPADGRVIYSEIVDLDALLTAPSRDGPPGYFERVRSTCGLAGTWAVIATYLSIFDVHFVRSPLSGRITYRRIPVVGRNLSMEWPMVAAILRRPLPMGRRGYCDKNEILCVGIDGNIPVVLILMGDWWIRQIETCASEGAYVDRGQTIARIRMGSQVDVWVPADRVTFTRSPGEKVLAGETILGRKVPQGEGSNGTGFPRRHHARRQEVASGFLPRE